MINVCANCGSYSSAKEIKQNPTRAICPECQHGQPFIQQPLFIICGTNGGGKTAVCRQLQGQVYPFIPLEADILLRPEFTNSDNNPHNFPETWLRVCKNIGQAGKPVALFHAGGLPQNIEPCIEQRYFSSIHYLALVADDATITARLQARPIWRGYTPAVIADQIAYNQWFWQESPQHTHSITLLDTTNDSIAQTTAKVVRWVTALI